MIRDYPEKEAVFFSVAINIQRGNRERQLQKEKQKRTYVHTAQVNLLLQTVTFSALLVIHNFAILKYFRMRKFGIKDIKCAIQHCYRHFALALNTF